MEVQAPPEPEVLLQRLADEMQALVATDAAETDTCLLIHPAVLTDFDDYNQFLDAADALLEDLGLEGVLVLSAMAAFGGAFLTGNVWMGVLCAMFAGACLAALHGVLCSLPRVNDVATAGRSYLGGRSEANARSTVDLPTPRSLAT